MVEKGFTILLDNSASQGGKQDKNPSSQAVSQPAVSSQSSMTPSPSRSEGSSASSSQEGSTQGPFVSKSQHPELSGLRLTDEGIKTILRQEGYRANAYPDAAGYSVGYGHFLGTDPSNANVNISPEQGLKYLADDLKKFEKQISDKVKYPLTDQQFTAVASFAYNAGAGTLDRGIAAKLNRGDLEGAADQMKMYVKSRDPKTKELKVNEDLVRRRAFETGLLLGK